MGNASKNLTLQRSRVNVWEQPGWMPDRSPWDRERLFLGLSGLGLALVGLRRRGWLGALLGASGAGMAVRAFQGHHDLTRARGWTGRRLRARGRRREEDIVDDASAESFPASDAPSWTPTAGARAKG